MSDANKLAEVLGEDVFVDLLPESGGPPELWLGSDLHEEHEEYPAWDLVAAIIHGLTEHSNDLGELDWPAAGAWEKVKTAVDAEIAKYTLVDMKQKYPRP